jgi:phage tail tape-measure protein
VAEVVAVSEASRLAALAQAGLVHPRAEAVTAPLFSSGGFFLSADKVQVKYEMLRAHLSGHVPVTAAAAAHGYSRAAFYLVAASFEQAGMAGLLDDRRGRRGPVKLRGEIAEFIRSAPAAASGAALTAEVADRFGVVLHRRTIERARAR